MGVCGINELISFALGIQIYQRSLQEGRRKKFGDASIFVAKRAWDRLNNDFSINEGSKRRLLHLCFDGDSKRAYEEVSDMSIGLFVDAMWETLEARLCNKVH